MKVAAAGSSQARIKCSSRAAANFFFLCSVFLAPSADQHGIAEHIHVAIKGVAFSIHCRPFPFHETLRYKAEEEKE